jgi:glycosyltransferase involved in cell wall biosynthesis
LIGDGPERGELASLEGHPRARFLGRQHAEDVPELLATFDVMVVPHQRLISEFYFCPIKVLEGMATGLACLASDQGDIPIMLDRGRAGRLVSTDDPGDWAAALTQLLDDPMYRLGLQAAARERVLTHYTWGHTARLLEDVLARAAVPTLARALVTAV